MMFKRWDRITIGFLFAIVLIVFLSMTDKEDCKGFKTRGGQLLDANCKPFVMRGINMPHAWFDKASYDALSEVASHGVNCVRIVWESELPVAWLEQIIQRCIELEMIPMVELHDMTGDDSVMNLLSMANYFVSPEMKQLIERYEKYLLINVANEWGGHELSTELWYDGYKKCIELLRDAGYQSTIVIDAPGWGQNIKPVLEKGAELIKEDPLHNLLYSVHMYGSWNDETELAKALTEVYVKQLPFIVGEFGYNYNNGDNNLNCMVNHRLLMETCNELQIGYLAWSWTGNNAANQWLDMCESSNWKTLTTWGEDIINSTFGIKKSAVKATVFE